MKNTMKIIGIIALAAVIVFGMIGCGDGSTSPTGGKTALSVPANLQVDDGGDKSKFELKWDAVEGVDKYELDIGVGDLIQVPSSRTYYDGPRLKDLIEDPKEYNIKIRAVADPNDPDYRTSAYSAGTKIEPAEYVFEFDTDNLSVSPSVKFARAVTPPGKKITGLTTYGNKLDRVVIPRKINNTEVTAIQEGAFEGNDTMTSVDLPNTITFIGNDAFAGTNITGIKLPESVTFVGDGAFSGCIYIVIVIFVSETPPEMGTGVFTGANAIETIVVPEGKSETFASAITESTPELSSTINDIIQEEEIFLITVSHRDGGTVTASANSSTEGKTVTITVTPDQGYKMTSVSVINKTTNTAVNHNGNGPYTFVMPSSDVTITAIFEKLTYTITTPATTGGTIRTSPSGSTNAGETVSIIITANSGYQFDASSLTVKDANNNSVSINTNGGNTGSGYTFTMPSSNVTVSGTFSQIQQGGSVNTALNGTWISKIISKYPDSFATCGEHQQTGYNPDCTNGGCRIIPGQTYESETELELNNGNFVMEGTKGTYTTTGTTSGNFVMTPTHICGGGSENGGNTPGNNNNNNNGNTSGNNTGSTEVWLTRSEYKSILITEGYSDFNAESVLNNLFAVMSGTYTVNATTLTLTFSGETQTYTKKQSYNITLNRGSGGQVSINPSTNNLSAGTGVEINIYPNQGYQLDSFTIKDANNNTVEYTQSVPGGAYNFVMPASNVTITITFKTSGSGTNPGDGGGGSTSYKINQIVKGGDGTTGNEPGYFNIWQNAEAGATVSFTVITNQGYTLDNITVTTGSNNSPVDFQFYNNGGSFTMPAADVTITAEFTQSGSGTNPGGNTGQP